VRDLRLQLFDRVVATGMPFKFQDQPLGRWEENSLFPVFDEDKNVTHVAIFSRDISAEKKAEEEVLSAKEEAEAANRTKSEFLANMSHELRTPLNAVIGFSDALIQKIFGELASDRQLEYVQNIHASGIHLLELINDILDVSVIETNQLELAEDVFDVAKCAISAINMINVRANSAGIEIATKIQANLPMLIADERRVKQMLANLLTNAVKFTKPGGRITVHASYLASNELAIEVTDTGIGMDQAGLEAALQKFKQLKAKEDDLVYEGTGLGLPLTKGLIEFHGGKFEIVSELGVGTKVSLIFPSGRTSDKISPGK